MLLKQVRQVHLATLVLLDHLDMLECRVLLDLLDLLVRLEQRDRWLRTATDRQAQLVILDHRASLEHQAGITFVIELHSLVSRQNRFLVTTLLYLNRLERNSVHRPPISEQQHQLSHKNGKIAPDGRPSGAKWVFEIPKP